MRIAVITSGFSETGIPFYHHLAKAGHKVDVFILSLQGRTNSGAFDFDEPVKGSQIVPIQKSNGIYKYLDSTVSISVVPYYLIKNRKYLIGFVPYLYNLFLVKKLINSIKGKEYDVIYVVVHEDVDVFVCQNLKKCGLKNVIVAYHEIVKDHINDSTFRKPVKSTMNLGFKLQTFSDFSNRQLRRTGLQLDVDTVYFGPFETFRQYDTSRKFIESPYILFIGSIFPYKGLSFFVDTMKKYGVPDGYKVVIAGSGFDPCLSDIENDDRFIVYNQFVEDAIFANLVRYATCVVCPYVMGSQSGITHTAMAFGTPIVATNVGAFPEFVENGKNGYLVEYGKKKQLWEAIKKVIDSEQNWCYVPEHLCWPNIIDRFISLIGV